MRIKPMKTAEPADGMVVAVGGGLVLTFKLLEQIPRRYPELIQRARDESVVYAVASAGQGNVLWAIWDSFARCEAGADPTAHGSEPNRTAALMKAQAAAWAIRRPNTVWPWQAPSSVVERWRRKDATRKRLERTSDIQQAQPVAYLYHHHQEIDLNTIRTSA